MNYNYNVSPMPILDKPEIEFKCPSCHHSGARRLALDYASGLSHSQSFMAGMSMEGVVKVVKNVLLLSSLSLLPVIGSMFFIYSLLQIISAFFFGVIFTRTQSALSSELSPPKRFPVLLVTLGSFGIVSTMFWIHLGFNHDVVTNNSTNFVNLETFKYNIVNTLYYLSYLIVPLFFILGIYYNNTIWSSREAAWQRSFMCERCGTIYIVENFSPKSISRVRSDKVGKGNFLPRFETPSQKSTMKTRGHNDEKTLRKKRYLNKTSTGN